MDWILGLWNSESVAQAVLVIALVSALGLALGNVRIFGVSLGVAGVLFSGILFGHFDVTIDAQVMEFVREFGLILFVYTIGLQVGPGFFSSLKRQGLPLNLMALAVVLLGIGMTFVAWRFGGLSAPVVAGLFSGATTNTPSLGAAQQALKELQSTTPELLRLPGLAYAVGYPFGILGVILGLLGLRAIFRVRIQDEAAALEKAGDDGAAGLSTVNLEVQNKNLDGLPLRRIPGLKESGVLISRIMQAGQLRVAQADTIIHVGDVLLAVGKPEGLDEIRVCVGAKSAVDLKSMPSSIVRRKLVVTNSAVVGKNPKELNLARRYGVTISRIMRSEIEFTPSEAYHFQFGDRVTAVGEEEAIVKVEEILGNAIKLLDRSPMIPVFLGIVLGVLVGSIPLRFPGTPAAVRLGLAGGPLIVAILLSRLGHVGKLVWYMPAAANYILRELGIVLFLACVGLRAGDQFFETLFGGSGLAWIGWSALITLVPILIVGAVARVVYKLNFLTISGLLAGSMTDPPALAFANMIAGSETPSISYATVYPLTMLLRVVGAQVLVFLLAG